MALAQIPVLLSQKPSTENGQFRVAVLILAWGYNKGVLDRACDSGARGPRPYVLDLRRAADVAAFLPAGHASVLLCTPRLLYAGI